MKLVKIYQTSLKDEGYHESNSLLIEAFETTDL